MHGAPTPKVPHGAAGVVGAGTPRARQRKPPKFRVVCEGDDGKITLRAKAEDKYEAFKQIIMFLREKRFGYQAVLVEPT
ncbi:MAG: hypothetical protein LC802_15855 [Acidobacteria bacterium]|nr:hypothetical protein [Acidobacteriota bacterium]